MLDVQLHTTSTSIDKIYNSYVSIYEEDLGFDMLLKYNGEFSLSLIRSFASSVEEMMTNLKNKRHVIKKMFSILVEGLQNIYLHGGTNEFGQQSSFLILASNKRSYKIVFGNIVEPNDRSSLKFYLGNINNHSNDELKTLYVSILQNGYITKKNGAGLGIVTMRIKSDNDLKYHMYDLPSKKSFLVMEVELIK